MTAPVTVVRGRAPDHPRAPVTTDDVCCYRTDDGQILLVLPGARPRRAAELAESIDVRSPVIDVCDRDATITADPDGPDTGAGYQVWITITTTFDEQRPLADVNRADTRSTMRHLPGFRSVAIYLGRNRPTVVEHVSWESERHYAAAAARPEFAHHLRHVERVATGVTWQRLWPCPRD